MEHYICVTCGTQYSASDQPPDHCPICADERQYIGHDGQQWTTMDTIRGTHKNVFKDLEPGLTGIGSEPRFAIGQRALLLQSPEGNILWDCITLLDDDTIDRVHALGGIDRIAISHPHFYSAMIEWSKAFDAPIYIHEGDRQWLMRADPAVIAWSGDTHELGGGRTLIRCGGHFAGSQVLHWAGGAGGKGALFTGDTVYVVADRRYVSFMRSFPNLIPLPPSAIHAITQTLDPFAYDRIYSGWFGSVLPENAKANLTYSAQRYLDAITD